MNQRPQPASSMTPTTLVVVGFPKSGTTWLTRLLADAINSPVLGRWLDQDVKFASEVNRHLREPHHPAVRLARLHDLPEAFARRGLSGPFRFVYIHRDPRDVAVSTFFHFTGWDVATVRSLLHAREVGPWRAWRRWRVRSAIRRFLRRFASLGIPRLEDRVGRWDQHVRAWFQSEDPILPVSYEELLADTPRTLGRIVASLQLSCGGTTDIHGAIARQTLDLVQLGSRQTPSDPTSSRGRALTQRAARRGMVGDWRAFLERDQVDLIRARFAEVFNQLGYNRDWREAAVADRLEAAA